MNLPAPLDDLNKDAERRQRLRTMQGLALALLGAMALLFILAETQRSGHPAWGYVAAFAEAAMVGALADWFAVVALFRHPMGLPIWHTAIVPQRKDDIARNLGEFIESHFVSVEAVLARLRSFDPARRAATWLQQAPNSQALGQWLAPTVHQLLADWDDSAWRDTLRNQLQQRLGAKDLMPLATTWAEHKVAQGRHQQGFDWLLQRWIGWLESDDANTTIAQVLSTVDHMLVSSMASTIAPILKNASLRLCKAALEEPDHLLRQRYHGLIGQLLNGMRTDPGWAERLSAVQQELLHSQPLQQGFDTLWAELKHELLSSLASPTDAAGSSLARMLSALGHHVGANPATQAWINQALCQWAEPLVANNHGKVAAYVQTQVQAWSKEEMSQRIELAIGRDLQFIRINGTVVGGLAGLVLYAAVQWART